MGLNVALYTLLGQLLECAQQQDDRIYELNRGYDPLLFRASLTSEEFSAYDLCRQSCVMSVRMPFYKKSFLDDAVARFNAIPEPVTQEIPSQFE